MFIAVAINFLCKSNWILLIFYQITCKCLNMQVEINCVLFSLIVSLFLPFCFTIHICNYSRNQTASPSLMIVLIYFSCKVQSEVFSCFHNLMATNICQGYSHCYDTINVNASALMTFFPVWNHKQISLRKYDSYLFADKIDWIYHSWNFCTFYIWLWPLDVWQLVLTFVSIDLYFAFASELDNVSLIEFVGLFVLLL